jgi:hypothetical protein
MTDTLLVIAGADIPPFACRGATEILQPIALASDPRRDVLGNLYDLAPPQMRKLKWTVSCDDMRSPALDSVWPGDTIIVNCISERNYVTIAGTPSRTVVSGSSRVEGAQTFYRPQLTIRVTAINVKVDEYGAAVSWQIDGEEA